MTPGQRLADCPTAILGIWLSFSFVSVCEKELLAMDKEWGGMCIVAATAIIITIKMETQLSNNLKARNKWPAEKYIHAWSQSVQVKLQSLVGFRATGLCEGQTRAKFWKSNILEWYWPFENIVFCIIDSVMRHIRVLDYSSVWFHLEIQTGFVCLFFSSSPPALICAGLGDETLFDWIMGKSLADIPTQYL